MTWNKVGGYSGAWAMDDFNDTSIINSGWRNRDMPNIVPLDDGLSVSTAYMVRPPYISDSNTNFSHINGDVLEHQTSDGNLSVVHTDPEYIPLTSSTSWAGRGRFRFVDDRAYISFVSQDTVSSNDLRITPKFDDTVIEFNSSPDSATISVDPLVWHEYYCEIDVSNNTASLSIDGGNSVSINTNDYSDRPAGLMLASQDFEEVRADWWAIGPIGTV